MTNFSDMLSKAKAMQEKMKEVQDQIKKIEVEGEAGGNLVKVILSGDYEIKSITIRPERSLILICLAISSAASTFVLSAVFSIFNCFVD